jgi:hypothetical protein
MKTTTIKINAGGGLISVNVSCPGFPFPIVGLIYRYNADGSYDQEAGLFTYNSPDVNLGAPTVILGKYFRVEGAVHAMGDNPPAPYKVVVTVSQDGTPLSSEVPENGGSGNIGGTDIHFRYQFTFQP